MKVYTFWNNKGGTGKTSLCFQTMLQYAVSHAEERILVVDLCPQANLTELMLGGMLGNGAGNMQSLYSGRSVHQSIGGYFYDHILSPYSVPAAFNAQNYICSPSTFNNNIPQNVDLVAGDPIIEYLTNTMSAQASTQIPTNDAFIKVVTWVREYLESVANGYSIVFIDTNPSFSIYTQMALAATNYLIIPVTADDSSVRALHNVLSLIYGIGSASAPMPNSFNSQLVNANITLPQIHMLVRNRLTQYMGTARGYNAVLDSINTLASSLRTAYPQHFSSNFAINDVRDFQTVGVVAFAEAQVFSALQAAVHNIGGNDVQISQNYIQNCVDAMAPIVNNI